MNRRALYRSCIAAALAGLVFIPVASHAQLSPQWANGIWKIQAVGKEFRSGTMCLSMQNYRIVGFSTPKPGSTDTRRLAIRGELKNNQLNGTWTVTPGGDTGWLTFNFGATFRTFSGEYGQAGKKPMGNITGTFLQRGDCESP